MPPLALCRLLPASLAAVAFAAAAQPAAAPKVDPLDPSAKVPAVVYRSTLTGYQRHADQPLAPWKAANDTVTRIGGWRVYAREASQPEPPAGAASAPDPHAGHHPR